MAPKRRTELDSLDLEVFGGPLDPATVALERDGPFVDPDSDEALEAALCRELLEIAGEHDVSDPEILRERLFGTLGE
jgi:hypothetical protein